MPRVIIGNVSIDATDVQAALDGIVSLARSSGGTVFTPNADHIVRAASDLSFAQAYARCSLSVCDGAPVLWASRILGTPLPEKIAGSILLPQVFARCATEQMTMYLVGGRQDASLRVIEHYARTYPSLRIIGHSLPTQALNAGGPAAMRHVESELRRVRPDVVCVSLASPAQETWADGAHQAVGHGAFVCTGSAIDMLAGLVPYAPVALQRLGLEWAFRLALEPRRLAPRYLWRDPFFFYIVLRQLFAQGRLGR